MGIVKAVLYSGFILLLVICSDGGANVVTVDVHAATHLLAQAYIYLDVRTEEEFKNGHLKNALNIPYWLYTPEGMVKNPKFVDQVLSHCDKEDRLVVGCKSGVRSVYATTDLLNAEFKHVYNMGGGYLAWVESGYAVENLHSSEL
ncbi:rhodanese-like domain-containing protein 17 [Salvia miltiorrhiza]|uniref:rhodanese-like domain-containing protein 17 n=1 Tax=Salvia miltiorrhiza TaxID=226208 RepID=UPI0025ABC034|nr:rhodanese-like domain-containing protein 17 [Salvia miltiorrhiza]XP_057809615.1 rhodanese-like domain-containing protein 17 [Salvia miltiorrhiza]